MNSMSRATFYRHIAEIEACGLSKAMLQNLAQHDNVRNVVPVLQLIHIDFASQRPDWYVEPSVEAA
ncbi:phage/plasmid replication protein [compost metagenome]